MSDLGLGGGGEGRCEELQGGQKTEEGVSLEEGPFHPIPLPFIYSQVSVERLLCARCRVGLYI